MKIAAGSDHAGYTLKTFLIAHLEDLGHEVLDLGTNDAKSSVDYPDFGAAVGRSVAKGEAELGLCVCGTGIGVSIAANKIPSVRAALIYDVTTARLARRHNDANVVCLGGRTTGYQTAIDAIDEFLTSIPEHGRHDRRTQKITELDAAISNASAPSMGAQ